METSTFLNVGVQEQSATDNPHVRWVGAVLADEIASTSPLDSFTELWIFIITPLAFNGEIAHVEHPVVGERHRDVGATESRKQFLGDFNAVHGVVGLGRANHPSIGVNLSHVVLLEKLLWHLLPCIASSPYTDDYAIAEGFPPFEGVHEELARNGAVHQKVNKRFRSDGLRFRGNPPAREKSSNNFHRAPNIAHSPFLSSPSFSRFHKPSTGLDYRYLGQTAIH